MVLLTPNEPGAAMIFTYFASYSMIPLYIKDNNLLMAVAVIFGFLVLMPKEDVSKGWRILVYISVFLFGYYAFPPPARYPDLQSVVISAFSCFVFSLFYLVMLKKQWDATKTDYFVFCHTVAQTNKSHFPPQLRSTLFWNDFLKYAFTGINVRSSKCSKICLCLLSFSHGLMS